MSTHTYVMGKQALMAFEMPECSKNHWHLYRSNWRILHIDGFEPGYGSRMVHFDFETHAVKPGWAPKVGERTVYENCVWVNTGKVMPL